MVVEIRPGIARGTVAAPPSKSMAHRYLICAALSQGVSLIHNVSLSKDIEATIGGLRELGAEITIKGNDVTVKGIENGVRIDFEFEKEGFKIPVELELK